MRNFAIMSICPVCEHVALVAVVAQGVLVFSADAAIKTLEDAVFEVNHLEKNGYPCFETVGHLVVNRNWNCASCQ